MSLANLTKVDKGGYIFLRRLFVFSREISVAPQLWGNEYEAEKNNYLAGGNNYFGSPSGRF